MFSNWGNKIAKEYTSLIVNDTETQSHHLFNNNNIKINLILMNLFRSQSKKALTQVKFCRLFEILVRGII